MTLPGTKRTSPLLRAKGQRTKGPPCGGPRSGGHGWRRTLPALPMAAKPRPVSQFRSISPTCDLPNVIGAMLVSRAFQGLGKIKSGRKDMKRLNIGGIAAGCALWVMMGMLGTPANAWLRGHVQQLTVLPDAAPGVQSSVEGLTVGPDGNIYVPTFGFNTTGPTTGPATLFVISPAAGKVVRQVTLKASPPASPHMLGLAFNPVTGRLLILDFGSGLATGTASVLDVDPNTGNASVFATVPTVAGSGTVPAINALTFDRSGN